MATLLDDAQALLGQIRRTDEAADAAVEAARNVRRMQRRSHKMAAEFARKYGIDIGLPEDSDVMVAAAAPKNEPD